MLRCGACAQWPFDLKLHVKELCPAFHLRVFGSEYSYCHWPTGGKENISSGLLSQSLSCLMTAAGSQIQKLNVSQTVSSN